MAKLTLAADFPDVSASDWLGQVEANLGSGAVDRLVTKTGDGIAIQPIYPTPKTSPSPLITNTKRWKIVQRTDIPDFTTANSQILDDLLNGATGISVVLPGGATAGSYGVPVYSANDFKRLTKDVELDLISLRLDGGRHGLKVGRHVLEVYQDRNLDLSRCDLTLAIDPVTGFALSGSSIGLNDLSNQMTDVLEQARNGGHQGVVFSGDGRIYHESGASQGQELGFAIASVVQHLHLLAKGSTDLASIWPHLGLILSADADQFLTIAKLRAAHLVWQRLQEAMDVEPVLLQLDVETSRRMMSKLDPHVNMLRTTTATFSGGVGGASSIAILPFTSAIGLPDSFARRIARNAHIVLQEESSIGLVGDAAAGSGYVEEITNQIAEKAWKAMQEIEAKGGMFEALSSGHVQKSIADNATKTSAAVKNNQHVLVGINKFTTEEKTPVRTLDLKPVSDLEITEAQDLNCDRLEPARLSEPFEKLASRG